MNTSHSQRKQIDLLEVELFIIIGGTFSIVCPLFSSKTRYCDSSKVIDVLYSEWNHG